MIKINFTIVLQYHDVTEIPLFPKLMFTVVIASVFCFVNFDVTVPILRFALLFVS